MNSESQSTMQAAANTKPPVDLKKLVDAVKRAEGLLETKFGASGRGLYEKLSSVEAKVPHNLHGTIKYMATVRNKAMHEDGYEVKDFDVYIGKAEWVISELEKGPVREASPSADAELNDSGAGLADPGQSRHGRDAAFFIVGGITAIVALLSLPFHNQVAEGVAGTATNAAPASTFLAARPPRVPTETTPATAPAKPATPASPDAKTPADVAALVANGQSAGIGNSALRISRVTMSYVKGSWDKDEPKIVAYVTNVSDRTISDAYLEARLYIDDARTPTAVATPAYFFFGERGLSRAPAQRSTSLWGAPRIHLGLFRMHSTRSVAWQRFGSRALTTAPKLPLVGPPLS